MKVSSLPCGIKSLLVGAIFRRSRAAQLFLSPRGRSALLRSRECESSVLHPRASAMDLIVATEHRGYRRAGFAMLAIVLLAVTMSDVARAQLRPGTTDQIKAK